MTFTSASWMQFVQGVRLVTAMTNSDEQNTSLDLKLMVGHQTLTAFSLV